MQKGGKGLMSAEPSRRRTGFTLVEMVMVVLFLGILAAVAIPRLNYAVILKHKVEATTKKIVTDLRLTRRLAISDAANNTKGFNLKMVGSSPYTAYEIENDDTNVTVASYTLDPGITIICPTGITFAFGPLGNSTSASEMEIEVSVEDRSFTITILSATGAIKCVED